MTNITLLLAANIGHGGLMLAAEEVKGRSVFEHFVVAGGWITWFMLIPLSIATVSLVIHYLITIRRGTQVPESLAKEALTLAGQKLSIKAKVVKREAELFD